MHDPTGFNMTFCLIRTERTSSEQNVVTELFTRVSLALNVALAPSHQRFRISGRHPVFVINWVN